jgi:hypothetical protein
MHLLRCISLSAQGRSLRHAAIPPAHPNTVIIAARRATFTPLRPWPEGRRSAPRAPTFCGRARAPALVWMHVIVDDALRRRIPPAQAIVRSREGPCTGGRALGWPSSPVKETGKRVDRRLGQQQWERRRWPWRVSPTSPPKSRAKSTAPRALVSDRMTFADRSMRGTAEGHCAWDSTDVRPQSRRDPQYPLATSGDRPCGGQFLGHLRRCPPGRQPDHRLGAGRNDGIE